jgi:hypothetical protein
MNQYFMLTLVAVISLLVTLLIARYVVLVFLGV